MASVSRATWSGRTLAGGGGSSRDQIPWQTDPRGEGGVRERGTEPGSGGGRRIRKGTDRAAGTGRKGRTLGRTQSHISGQSQGASNTRTVSGREAPESPLSPWSRTTGSGDGGPREGRAVDGLVPPMRLTDEQTEAQGRQTSPQGRAAEATRAPKRRECGRTACGTADPPVPCTRRPREMLAWDPVQRTVDDASGVDMPTASVAIAGRGRTSSQASLEHVMLRGRRQAPNTPHRLTLRTSVFSSANRGHLNAVPSQVVSPH